MQLSNVHLHEQMSSSPILTLGTMSASMHARAKAAWGELHIDAYSPSAGKLRATSSRRGDDRSASSSKRRAVRREHSSLQTLAADNDPAFVDARLVASAVQQRLSTPGPGSRRSDKLPSRSQSSSRARSVPAQPAAKPQTPSDKFRNEFHEAMSRVKALQNAMSMPVMPDLSGARAEIAASTSSSPHSFSESGTEQLLHDKLSIPSSCRQSLVPMERQFVAPNQSHSSSAAASSSTGSIAAQARAAARQRSRNYKSTPTKKLHFKAEASASAAGMSASVGSAVPSRSHGRASGNQQHQQLRDSISQIQPPNNTSSPPSPSSRVPRSAFSSSTSGRRPPPAGGQSPKASAHPVLAGNAPGTASEMRHLREESAAALSRAARAERLLKEAVSELSAWRLDRAALVEGRRQAEERGAVLQSNVDELRSKVRAARARRAADAQALSDAKAELRALRGEVHDRDAQLVDAHAVMDAAEQETSILRAQLQASEEQRAQAEGEVEVARVQLARLRGALDALHARSTPPSPGSAKQSQEAGTSSASNAVGDGALVAQLLARLTALETKGGGGGGGSTRQRGDSAGSSSADSSAGKATTALPEGSVRVDDIMR